MKTPILASVAIGLVLAGCQLTPLASPPTATPARPPAATAAPSPTPLPSVEADAAATSQPQPSTDDGETGAAPSSTLFDVAWDDRSPFAAGLVSSQQATLGQQPGASVYHLEIALGEDMATLHGREEVRYTNTEEEALDEVVFRLFPNLTGGSIAVSNLTVDGQPVEPRYELSDSVMLLPLDQPLQPGQQAVIAMDIEVVVPTDLETSNYGTFAFFDDVLALAHFYPMIAVHNDEGWNVEIAPPEGDVVFADSSYYLVRITAPEDQTLVTSGVAVEQGQDDGRQVVTAAAGPARDFYLAASDDYEAISQQVGEVTVNSYAPRALRPGSRVVVDVAAAALGSFEALLGPYPYTELDLVSTATSALGVEYPGIVAITNRVYERGPAQQYLETTVAHEVGHQWFYNTVGNDQLDEPWLDEALTQYITMRYFGDRYGQEGYAGFREMLESRWTRAEETEIPVGLPVSAYSEGGDYPGTYGAIVYGRGPLFFEALQEAMGAAVFDSFLRDYYQKFTWGVATTESLRALAEQHCGCDLGQLFAQWVYAQ